MHKRTLLAALATAAITAVATPAVSHAQQQKESKGEVATPNFGSLISAINSSKANSEKLTAMTTLTAENVQLVNVEDLLQGNNVEALNAALTKNEADVTALRTTVFGNATISPLLKAKSPEFAEKDIVATDISADGKVIVYYWKKPA